MIKAIISDVSYVLLFPKNREYKGILNSFYKQIKGEDKFSFFDYFFIYYFLIMTQNIRGVHSCFFSVIFLLDSNKSGKITTPTSEEGLKPTSEVSK